MEIRRPCPLSGIPGKGTSTCHGKNLGCFWGPPLGWFGSEISVNFLFNWKDSSSFQFFDLKSTDILASSATSLEALPKLAPEELPNPNWKVISQPSFFRGYGCVSTLQLQACGASKPSRRSWRLSGAWKDQTGKHLVAVQCLLFWLMFKLHHISIYFAYSDWNKMSDNIKHLEWSKRTSWLISLIDLFGLHILPNGEAILKIWKEQLYNVYNISKTWLLECWVLGFDFQDVNQGGTSMWANHGHTSCPLPKYSWMILKLQLQPRPEMNLQTTWEIWNRLFSHQTHKGRFFWGEVRSITFFQENRKGVNVFQG